MPPQKAYLKAVVVASAVLIFACSKQISQKNPAGTAVSVTPRDAHEYVVRGIARQQMGDVKDSFDDYNQAAKLDPDNPSVYFNRANLRCALGQMREAIKDYDQTIALAPDYGPAFTGLGVAESELAENTHDQHIAMMLRSRALGHLNKSIMLISSERPRNIRRNLAVDLGTAYHNRSRVRFESGDKTGSVSDYNEAINLDPALRQLTWHPY